MDQNESMLFCRFIEEVAHQWDQHFRVDDISSNSSSIALLIDFENHLNSETSDLTFEMVSKLCATFIALFKRVCLRDFGNRRHVKPNP